MQVMGSYRTWRQYKETAMQTVVCPLSQVDAMVNLPVQYRSVTVSLETLAKQLGYIEVHWSCLKEVRNGMSQNA